MAIDFENNNQEKIIAAPEKAITPEAEPIKNEINRLVSETLNEGAEIFNSVPNPAKQEVSEFKVIQGEISDLNSDSQKALAYFNNGKEDKEKNEWWGQIKQKGRNALHVLALSSALMGGTAKYVGAENIKSNDKNKIELSNLNKDPRLENNRIFNEIFAKIDACSLLAHHKEKGVIPYYQDSFSLSGVELGDNESRNLKINAYMDDAKLNTLEFFDEKKKIDYIFDQGFQGLEMKTYAAKHFSGSQKKNSEKVYFIDKPEEFKGANDLYVGTVSEKEVNLILENIQKALNNQSRNPEFYSLANKKDISNPAGFSPEAKEFYQKKIEKLAAHVKSEEYFKKLKHELGDISDEETAKHVKVRLDNLLQGSYTPLAGDEIYARGSFMTNKETFEVSLPAKPEPDSTNNYALEHELMGHKTVDAGRGISPHALELIKKAMNIDENYMAEHSKKAREKFGPDRAEYIISNAWKDFSKPEEVYARIAALHIELEDKGIVKYGEKVTKEHIEKLKELDKNGQMSLNGDQLLHIVNDDDLPKLLNEIADSGKSKKNNIETFDYKENDSKYLG